MATSRKAGLKPLSSYPKKEVEKDFAWKVMNEHTLPKGMVRKLLSENGVDAKVIEKIITPLVPYGHTN